MYSFAFASCDFKYQSGLRLAERKYEICSSNEIRFNCAVKKQTEQTTSNKTDELHTARDSKSELVERKEKFKFEILIGKTVHIALSMSSRRQLTEGIVSTANSTTHDLVVVKFVRMFESRISLPVLSLPCSRSPAQLTKTKRKCYGRKSVVMSTSVRKADEETKWRNKRAQPTEKETEIE